MRSATAHIPCPSRFQSRFRLTQHAITLRLDFAPWIALAATIFFYSFALSPFVLHPGISIDLPRAPFQDGVPYNAHVVTLFKNDFFFLDGQRMPMEDLLRHFRQLAFEDPDLPILIKADTQISHGEVMDLCSKAAAAGLRRVVLATRGDEAAPGATP